MKNSLVIHCRYLLATVGTFVAGSQLARSPASGTPGEVDDREGNARFHTGTGPVPGTAHQPSGPEGGLESPIAAGTVGSDRQGAPAIATAGATPRGLRSQAFAPENGPLAEAQIEELVLTAIKAPDPVERRRAFDRLLEEMGTDTFSVAQAMAIRKAMHENGASGEYWRLFDYAWGANDPSSAIAHIDEIGDQHRMGYLGNMLPGLASNAPDTAIALFEGLELDQQGPLRRRLFEGLIDNDLAVATDYIYDATDPASYNWRPMDVLTREIAADKGLAETLEWAVELPEGALRSSAWSAAYAVWGKQDPHAAAEAISEMPPSSDRDQAINGFTAAHAGEDGGGAVIWAAEIESPSLREAAMIRAGAQFFQQDRSAAADWAASIGLPETALSNRQGSNGE